MAAMSSVIKKLQRCERISHGRDEHHVVKYTIKIKECGSSTASSSTISINSNCSLPFITSARALAELTDSLATSINEKFSSSHQPGTRFGRSPLKQQLQSESLLQVLASDESRNSKFCKPQLDLEPSLGAGSKSPWKLQFRGESSAKAEKEGSMMIQHSEEEEGMWAMFPWKLKLQEHAEEGEDEEVSRTAISGGQQAPKSLGKEVDERKQEKQESEAALQLEKKKKKKRKEWEVKTMECECCCMEEECTRGYEERVRGELCGHWLCGLCEEAVREERQRLGGRTAGGEISMQVALQAHMQPCRGFSSRARSKESPPPSAVGVPHAVCRLLRRHLSTPSPSPRLPDSLPRSSSCLPSFRHPT